MTKGAPTDGGFTGIALACDANRNVYKVAMVGLSYSHFNISSIVTISTNPEQP